MMNKMMDNITAVNILSELANSGFMGALTRTALQIGINCISEVSNCKRVVHCKYCINNIANTDGTTENWCYKFGYECNADDYCSYGELANMRGEEE